MAKTFTLEGENRGTFTATSATTIYSLDIKNYQSVAFAFSGTWVGTVVIEISNDNTNWFNCPCEAIDGTIKTSISSNTLLYTPLQAQYIRVRSSAYTSGTITVTPYLMYDGMSQPMTVLAQGNTAVNATPNAFAYPNRVAGLGRSSNPSAVTSGNVQELLMTLLGSPVVTLNAIPENKLAYTATITVNTDTAAFAAAGAGIRNYVTNLQLQNTGASATVFTLKDGSTVKMTLSLPASMTTPIIIPLSDAIVGTANTAMNVNTATASTVYVNVQGYKA